MKELIEHAKKRLFRSYSNDMHFNGTRKTDHCQWEQDTFRIMKRNVSDLTSAISTNKRKETDFIPLTGDLDKKRRYQLTSLDTLEDLKKELVESVVPVVIGSYHESESDSSDSSSSSKTASLSPHSPMISSDESARTPDYDSCLYDERHDPLSSDSSFKSSSHSNDHSSGSLTTTTTSQQYSGTSSSGGSKSFISTSSSSGESHRTSSFNESHDSNSYNNYSSSYSSHSQSSHHNNKNNNNNNDNHIDNNHIDNKNNNNNSSSSSSSKNNNKSKKNKNQHKNINSNVLSSPTFSQSKSFLDTNEFNSVQSTLPMEDDITYQLLQRQSSLQNESPMHDFDNEIAQRPSSTPKEHETVGSSFPEQDESIAHVLNGESDDDDHHHHHPDRNENESYYETRSPTHKLQQRHELYLKRQSSSSSLASNYESRQRYLNVQYKSKPQVLFSSNIPDDIKKRYSRFIQNSGGSIVHDWDKCTHLVTNEIRHTINILCASVSGKYIIHENWLKDSLECAKILDEEEYVLLCNTELNHFRMKKLYFTKSFINHPDTIKDTDRQQLARASGAKIIKKLPGDNDEDVIVITMNPDDEDEDGHFKNYEVLSKEQFLAKLKNL
ncbi:unnamed protein product [Cunninghamella blakesleeana]